MAFSVRLLIGCVRHPLLARKRITLRRVGHDDSHLFRDRGQSPRLIALVRRSNASEAVEGLSRNVVADDKVHPPQNKQAFEEEFWFGFTDTT
jgi:hypothetical protein